MDIRHLNPDGSAKFTNRLIAETSPYLRQHAHNPVDWYPWGEAGLRCGARRRASPSISVGRLCGLSLVPCVAAESFEDEATARY